jgi:hypothetical protein
MERPMSFSRMFDLFRAPKTIEELRALAEQQDLDSKARYKRHIEAEAALGRTHARQDIELWKNAIARAIRNGTQCISIDNNDEQHDWGSRDSRKENKSSVPGLNANRIFEHALGYDKFDPSGKKTTAYLFAYTNVLRDILGQPFQCRCTHHESTTNDDGYHVDAFNEIVVSWYK